MKNILFITCNDIFGGIDGGAKGSYRNYEALSKNAKVYCMIIKKKSSLKSITSIINGFYPPINKKDFAEFKREIHDKKIDVVFFDGSYYGKMMEYCAKNNIKNIVYFHNCEQDYLQVRFGSRLSVKKIIYTIILKKNEAICAQKANYKISLTQRDSERIFELYNSRVDTCIPLSLPDIYQKSILSNCNNCNEDYCLLLGPIGSANEEAFGWFVKNISPYIKIKTIIAGKGFDMKKEEWSSDKVTILGYQDSVVDLYNNALCVALPILSGAGIKIKTAEAMMFGKKIFGTDEAFVGYEKHIGDYLEKCNTEAQFIKAINRYVDTVPDKYYEAVRDIYLKNFSMDNCYKKFRQIIEMR